MRMLPTPQGIRLGDTPIPDYGWFSRLGFPGSALPDFPGADHRTIKNGVHLKHSLGYLDQMFSYLQKNEIRLYRLSTEVVPYASHPKLKWMWWDKQREEAQAELELTRQRALAMGLRLSFHAGMWTTLGAKTSKITRKALEDLLWHSQFLDAVGMGLESRVLIHVGGVYGNRTATKKRVIKRTLELPDEIKRRLTFENDDVSWPTEDVLDICQATQTPLTLDLHHHRINSSTPWPELWPDILATWPEGLRPKTHYSSPKDVNGNSQQRRAHAPYIDAGEFRQITKQFDRLGSQPDVMLECGQKNLALIRLRQDLRLEGAPPQSYL